MRGKSIFSLLIVFCFASFLFAQISATSVIYKIYHSFKISYSENKSVSLKNGLKKYFMIAKMSKTAIRDYWKKLGVNQKEEYMKLMNKIFEVTIFEDTAENIYRGSFKILRTQKLHNGNRKVYTKIYIASEDMIVQNDFKLQNVNNIWKIYDVYIDGASLVEDYRSQFKSIVEKYGFEEDDNSLFPRLRKAAVQSVNMKSIRRKNRKKTPPLTPTLLK